MFHLQGDDNGLVTLVIGGDNALLQNREDVENGRWTCYYSRLRINQISFFPIDPNVEFFPHWIFVLIFTNVHSLEKIVIGQKSFWKARPFQVNIFTQLRLGISDYCVLVSKKFHLFRLIRQIYKGKILKWTE